MVLIDESTGTELSLCPNPDKSVTMEVVQHDYCDGSIDNSVVLSKEQVLKLIAWLSKVVSDVKA